MWDTGGVGLGALSPPQIPLRSPSAPSRFPGCAGEGDRPPRASGGGEAEGEIPQPGPEARRLRLPDEEAAERGIHGPAAASAPFPSLWAGAEGRGNGSESGSRASAQNLTVLPGKATKILLPESSVAAGVAAAGSPRRGWGTKHKSLRSSPALIMPWLPLLLTAVPAASACALSPTQTLGMLVLGASS